MSSTEKHEAATADWRQLEDCIDQLHELARTSGDANVFYRSLLDSCVATLAAVGGAVWFPDARGRWTLAHQTGLGQVLDRNAPHLVAAHNALLQTAAAGSVPQTFSPHSGNASASTNPTEFVLFVSPVPSDTSAEPAKPRALVELFMRAGSSPALQAAWREFLTTICQLATTFHVHDELRTLRADRELHDQSLAFLHRIHKSTDLRKTVFEIANDGRRLVDCDRLSVLVRHGRSWRLLAVSGVDRIQSRGDAARRLQQLAQKVAMWGEPIDYAEGSAVEEAGVASQHLPPELAALVERHVDESHARQLVVVPFEFVEGDTRPPRRRRSAKPFAAVLIAEQFNMATGEFPRQRVIELAALCEPALRLTTRFNRFPLSLVVRWAERLARLGFFWRLLRFTLLTAALAGAVAALVYVPYDFEVEATAVLSPMVQRDIFATAEGTVAEVRVAHGDHVREGDVLAVLHDPQLALDEQRVQGEIETARKRLETITIERTARNVREDLTEGRLPISADGQQLEKQLASLDRQQEILAARREALELRSPITGTVLTLDVQNLLLTRPVERGQVLFTVADTNSGWELLAEVSQDRIGHVLAAEQQSHAALPVRFRLAGDNQRIYAGHVDSVTATAVLDSSSLERDPPTVQVRLAVDEEELSSARPGMTAQVRIDCGSRSLGYVWLHDVWETLYSWVVF